MSELVYTEQSIHLNYFEGPKNGTPVVLIHGNMGRWQTFGPLIERISDTKHVYALDLRGHGKSSHMPDSYLLKTHVQDVVSFIKHIVQEPVTLLGYSLGGMIALMIAAYHPELVQKLIVLDPPLTLETLTPIIQSQKEFGNRLLHYRLTNQIEQLYAELNDDTSAVAISMCDPNIIEITINQHERMLEGFNIDQLIPLIHCSSLLLRGEAQLGSMISDKDIEQVKRLSSLIKEKKMLGLGHSLPTEEEVILEIVQALASE